MKSFNQKNQACPDSFGSLDNFSGANWKCAVTRLRKCFGGQRKINRPFYPFWPVFSLIIPDTCQQVTCKKLNINMLKNEKMNFPVISGKRGQNVGKGTLSTIVPNPNKRGNPYFDFGSAMKKTAFLTILDCSFIVNY